MVESITIDTSGENEGPSLEEQAAAMDLKEEQEGSPDEAESRPEWLPEKFSSVEEMAKAYSELEKAYSSKGKEEETDGNGEESAKEKELAEVPSEKEAAELAENAGLDFYELSNTFWSEGDLSPEQYAALEESGIPRSMIEEYIDTQMGALQQQREEIMRELPGDNSYDDLTEWAAGNLEPGEIEAYNRIMTTNDPDSIRMAVRGLYARYSSEYGVEPKRNISGAEASQGGTYESVSQLTKDMSDPRYESDPAFRSKVEQKLSRSNIL